jgi:hypothetical protein
MKCCTFLAEFQTMMALSSATLIDEPSIPRTGAQPFASGCATVTAAMATRMVNAIIMRRYMRGPFREVKWSFDEMRERAIYSTVTGNTHPAPDGARLAYFFFF